MKELQHQEGVRSGVWNTTGGAEGVDGCERTSGLLQMPDYYYALTCWPVDGIFGETLTKDKKKTFKSKMSTRSIYSRFACLPVSLISAPFPAGTNTVTTENGKIELYHLATLPLFIFIACFVCVHFLSTLNTS